MTIEEKENEGEESKNASSNKIFRNVFFTWPFIFVMHLRY